MNNRNNAFAFTLGLGMAGGLIGSYLLMSPKHQKDIQKNLSRAVDELTDIIDDIGDGIKNLK